MRLVRALPTPLMSCGQLLQLSCRPVYGWSALKERAAAPTAWGITPSSIMSPDPGSADQDKAGRPRARAVIAPLPTACLGVVAMR
jgi:hypothetical protein